MSRFFLSCLALGALALMVTQAIAGSGVVDMENALQYADNANGGVVIIETYSSSSAPTSNPNDMQPLPGDPGVEVAPLPSNTASSEPVQIQEDMVVSQSTSNN